jgi:hypothetical protein
MNGSNRRKTSAMKPPDAKLRRTINKDRCRRRFAIGMKKNIIIIGIKFIDNVDRNILSLNKLKSLILLNCFALLSLEYLYEGDSCKCSSSLFMIEYESELHRIDTIEMVETNRKLGVKKAMAMNLNKKIRYFSI